jgi:hypothetical protein
MPAAALTGVNIPESAALDDSFPCRPAHLGARRIRT